MRKMPVISSDAELNDRVERICGKLGSFFQPVFLDNSTEALEYIMYELPEVNLINFSDSHIDSTAILDTIKADPWLHYGGIIGVHNRKDHKALEEQMPDSNVISLIPRGDFVSTFFRVLRILIQNRRIIFQRDLQSYLLGSISGSFVMDNDPFNVRTYANLVSNYLYNSNYIDREARDRLHVALFEMLMNAVEHGNCSIDYEEKNAWLNEHGDILDLVREKCKDPEIRKKRVNFSYRIIAERSYFTIRDEGQGFDWKSRVSGENEVNLDLHGHGIRMTKHYIENMRYNDAGNEVHFELSHQHDESNLIPTIFQEQEERTFDDGETVFNEGEESNYLYYIVSGRFDIYAGGNLISDLTPDDIFIGEMSFLLNDRRSATVLSKGRSRVKPIPKKAFVNVIKAQPHYGIFLARLLAQRLNKLNAKVAGLKSAG